MIAIPAVDLRDGACVQLVGGSYDDERVRRTDPVGVAQEWARFGFSRVHVVDLDAATGRGDNGEIVRTILRDADVPVQVGGGVRSQERVSELLHDGARAVIVGTRAMEDPDWLADLAAAHPHEIMVAADVRGRHITTHGWTRTSTRDIVAWVEQLAPLPLAGLLVTAVHKEGLLGGTDLRLMEDVVDVATAPVFASGGVHSRHDLDELARCGVAGAVIGMALYTGALDPRLLAEEYGG